MSAPICIVDTETDGVHPGRKIWEIALLRLERGKPPVEWSAYVEIDLSTADPAGLRIGRFYDRHPLGQFLAGTRDIWPHSGPRMIGPGVDEAAQPPITPLVHAASAVARLTHGAHLVGAVPNFDSEILDRLLREHQLVPAWHYHLIDVETLAVGYLAAHGRRFLPPWSSDDLTTALDLPPVPDDERHTALGDVHWAASIYHRITQPGPVQLEWATRLATTADHGAAATS